MRSGPDSPHAEGRIEECFDCNIEARIELSNRLAIGCQIKTLSGLGCKLQVTDALFLPEEFDLLIPVLQNTVQRRRVHMTSRKDDMVSGEFAALPSE